jgi:Fis family transcriptional regulator
MPLENYVNFNIEDSREKQQQTQAVSSLAEAVRNSVENYLHSLDEEEMPDNLYDLVLAEMEVPLFEKVLEYTNGFETRTSKILGIARGTLRTKLQKYAIDRRDFKWPRVKKRLKNRREAMKRETESSQ